MAECPNNFDDRDDLDETAQRIRNFNDQFRQTFEGGQIVFTRGFRALPNGLVIRAFQAIQNFDDFEDGNDPYGTHEFGNVELDGQTVWFKIDAYDQNLEYGSPDPSDPDVTKRVMTILLPEEY